MDFNLGKLRDQVQPARNIVYYRRGADELSLNLTNQCPNSCVFCIRDRDPGWGVSNLYLQDDPALDEIIRATSSAIDSSPKTDITKIKICGYGEPILRAAILPELVEFLKERLPQALIQLTTTGWPVYHVEQGPEHFERAASLGLGQIYLGLNALTAADYKKIVKPCQDPELTFSQTLDFISLSRRLGLHVILSFVDIRGSLDREEIARFARKLDCDCNIREFEE